MRSASPGGWVRLPLAFALIAPALAGCLGPTVEPIETADLASTLPVFRYLCPGGAGEGAAEPCLAQLPRGDAMLQQPYVAIHPGNPQIMAVGVHYANPAGEVALGLAAGDASGTRLAVYVTEDGGGTWRESFAPPPVMSDDPARVGQQGDAALLFDAQGRLHVTAIAAPGTLMQLAAGAVDPTRNGQRIYYVQSDDLGKSWGESTLLQDNGLDQERNWIEDRNWIVRDPVDDTLYVTWQNYPEGAALDEAHVLVAWSLDAGATWRAQDPEHGAPCYRAGTPVVLQGTLRFACAARAANGAGEMVQIYSFDPSIGKVALVAQIIAEGAGAFPSLTLLADGTLAMHYDTCRNFTSPPFPPDPCPLDSWLLRSRDGGLTWGPMGTALGLAEDAWDLARIYAAEADPFGGLHLLVRYERNEPQAPADPTGRVLTPVTYELRHIVLDGAMAVAHSATLAAWRTESARAHEWIPNYDDDGSQPLGHPRCGGSSCFYGLAGAGDHALLAWSRDGAVELAALRCVAECTPILARILDASSLAATYVPPTPPAGLDQPVEYEFVGHVNVPGCYVESDPSLESLARHQVRFEFEVPPTTRFVAGTLDWETQGPLADLDVYLYDAAGDRFRPDDDVPETFDFELQDGDQGTWTALVVNCENLPTDFTLDLELS